jgi:hypothetical protein
MKFLKYLFSHNISLFSNKSDYSIELQAIAEHCVFGEFLDTVSRDRFVAGLKSSKVKAKTLNEAKDSNFEFIVQMAVSSELVDEMFV